MFFLIIDGLAVKAWLLFSGKQYTPFSQQG
jgi:hypothetical protein